MSIAPYIQTTSDGDVLNSFRLYVCFNARFFAVRITILSAGIYASLKLYIALCKRCVEIDFSLTTKSRSRHKGHKVGLNKKFTNADVHYAFITRKIILKKAAHGLFC